MVSLIPQQKLDQFHPTPFVKVEISDKGIKWHVIGETLKHLETSNDANITRIYSIDKLRSLLVKANPKDLTDQMVLNKLVNTHIFKKPIEDISNTEMVEILEKSENNLDNINKIDHFLSKYNEFAAQFPHLALDHDTVAARLNELAELNLELTDCSETIFESDYLFDELIKINEQCKEAKNSELQKAAFDLLLGTSLIPTKHQAITGKKGACFHQEVQPLSPYDIPAVLIKTRDNPETLFKPNDPFSYQNASYSQRIFLLSLLNFDFQTAESIKNDPLALSIYQRDDLMEWMFTSSGSIEQQFVNTCIGASVQQKSFSHASVVAGLTVMGKQIVDRIEKQLTPPQTPDQKKALKEIEKIKKEIGQFEVKLTKLLKKETTNPKKLEKLYIEWGSIFQKSSLLMNPHKTSLAVSKPIKNGWLSSSLIMFFPVLFRFIKDHISAWAKLESGPDSMFYIGRLRQSDVNKLLDEFKDFDHKEIPEKFQGVDFDKYLKKAKENQIEHFMTELWEELALSGGVILSTSYHGMYLKAGQIGEDKIFLLSDPKVDYYQAFTEPEFRKFLKRERTYIRKLKNPPQ